MVTEASSKNYAPLTPEAIFRPTACISTQFDHCQYFDHWFTIRSIIDPNSTGLLLLFGCLRKEAGMWCRST